MIFLRAFRNTRYMQYLSAIIATLSAASASMYLSWASPALVQLTSKNSPIGVIITPEEGSWIASSFLLGSIPGSILTTWIINNLGPKNTLLISAFPLALPWIGIIFAKSALALCVMRFIGGFRLAIVTVAATTYNGEIAEKDIRGKLGTAFGILRLLGSLYVLCVGPFVSYLALATSCFALPVCFAILFYFMPESPYYLIKIKKRKTAKKNLLHLSRTNTPDKIIEDRLKEIQATVEYDMRNKSTLWEFLSKEKYRKSLIVMAGIKALQALGGTTAINSYIQTIIASSNSSISPELSSIISGLVQVPAVFIAAVLVDKLGRKPLMLISTFGCAVALIGEGIYFYLFLETSMDVTMISWLPTVALMLFLIMNPLGISTLQWILLGEMFATNIKGIAVSTSTFYGGILSFLTIKFFQPISNSFGMYATFWVFAGICIFGGIFCLIMQPETKGKTFAEIQIKLNSRRAKMYVETTQL